MTMKPKSRAQEMLALASTLDCRWQGMSFASLVLGGCLALLPLAARAGSPLNPELELQTLSAVAGQPSGLPFLQAQAIPDAVSRYLVFVDGDSPLLLQQVQGIEPTAFRRFLEDRTVIQAGVFEDAANAEARIQELQTQGIAANLTTVTLADLSQFDAPPVAVATAAPAAADPGVVYTPAPTAVVPEVTAPLPVTTGGVTGVPPATVASTAPPQVFTAPAVTSPVPPEVYSTPTPVFSVPNVETFSSPAPPPFTAAYYDAGPAPLPRGYYVSIPARGETNLAVLQERVVALRTGGWGLYPRRGPLGRHVAVGPFAKRHSAESWSEYYRANGLDARVFRSTR